MQKILSLSILLLFVQTVYAQAILDIRFHSLQSGSVKLVNTKTRKSYSLLIKEGLLTFQDTLVEPTLFSMVVEGYNDSRPLNLILSNQKTHVAFGTFSKVGESETIRDLYPNQPSFIKDPNSNQTWYAFHREWMNFYDTIRDLSTSDSNEMLEKRKQVYDSFLTYCETIVKNNSDKYVAALIIEYLLRDNLLPLETIQTYYDYLAPQVKESFFGIQIGEYAGKKGRLGPGNPAPTFELVDMNNQPYRLNNLKGKMVLLHFWSSTCAPCIKEAPELIALTNENKHRLVILNISLDSDKDKWKKAIERAGMNALIHVCDGQAFESKVAQEYAIRVVPSYYLIDEGGKIMGSGSLNQMSSVLKKKVP
ncbi:TlpA disulfide reductase family protein [Rhodocytophaga aerolata]|uniref:TlpA disulfide reductase family protein n=1 Tax=Rhodocytophaga aerolata TaxID=455078 RepID=A0ABT8RCL6_9BACT|nr:TlpA disulfide reductase family protein [Rhodocytophaga aerolata]MDO1449851.1 TlpA disulfide reductase family protein [Rhodocytophaga aerolata]